MSEPLLLDEHYSPAIAVELSETGHDVIAVLSLVALRAAPDADIFSWAAAQQRRIVTENIRDFRPLLHQATAVGDPAAPLLLVTADRFPRHGGAVAFTRALRAWLTTSVDTKRPMEDWLLLDPGR